MSKSTTQSGFTLIEVLIYIFLVSVVIGGSLGAVYNILESSGSLTNKTLAEQEADFIAKKIAWVLNGVSAVNLPAPNSSGVTLSVNKNSYSLNPLVVNLSGSQIFLKRGNAPILPLSGQQVTVSSLSFDFTRIGTGADMITASFYVNEKKFQITRHVK